MSDILKMKEHSETLERYRDVIKKNLDGAEYVIYGIENQMSVNYAMPLRNMVYDALGYLQEYEELVRHNKKEKKWSDSAEFLSGLKKTDRLHPVITLVIMIRNGLAVEEIVRYAGVALEEVRQVQKNIAEKMKTVPA